MHRRQPCFIAVIVLLLDQSVVRQLCDVLHRADRAALDFALMIAQKKDRHRPQPRTQRLGGIQLAELAVRDEKHLLRDVIGVMRRVRARTATQARTDSNT